LIYYFWKFERQGQSFGSGSVSATNQAPASGAPAQPRQKVRARRGQATDPHSIAERVCNSLWCVWLCRQLGSINNLSCHFQCSN